MTCKDCIHYGVCERCDNPVMAYMPDIPCSDFKNTSDFAEVKHGEWDSNGDFYNCSVCNNYAGYDYDYCPYCGAKMDGRRDT